jgi:predicted phosphoribosyltransferase
MFRDRIIFENRTDAGIRLGKALSSNYKDKNALVVAVPRGGVEVAYWVARILHGELAVIVSKKLPYPGQPEYACGAVAEDGSVYLSHTGERMEKRVIDEIVKLQLEEISRRVDIYRNGKSIPSMKGRVVIIVDDGIATGSTIVPIIKMCRKNDPKEIIVSAPVSGHRYSKEIDELADKVEVLEVPDDYYAVGQVYDDFHGMDDEEVLGFLRDFEKNKS